MMSRVTEMNLFLFPPLIFANAFISEGAES